tara:strand:- start:1846 stop:2634 length:789 start_codon:yes stop_codon:yes gene_type:complete
MNLEVILRTCDRRNVSSHPRFIKVSKKELLLGCFISLIHSLNLVKEHNIHLIVLDDNSSEETQNEIRQLFSHCNFLTELIILNEKGNHYSALKQFEYCKNSSADIVYSVEDDYLHSPSTISEALYEYDNLSLKYNLKKPLCLSLWDLPEEYLAKQLTPELVFRGRDRHWKTGWSTTNTFMTTPEVFQEHWHLFHKLATEYTVWNGEGSKHDTVHEGNTINYIWEKKVMRLNPIPTLTLHLQSNLEEDPYINWRQWWRDYTKL